MGVPPIPTETPTTAEIRNNPRFTVLRTRHDALMKTRDDILNSVPCEPPSKRYVPPDGAVICSIPDWTMLRPNSRVDAQDEFPEEVASSYQHMSDSLSSCEHYDDGLSDPEDSVGGSPTLVRDETPEQQVPVTVNTHFADLSIIDMSVTNEINAWQMQALLRSVEVHDDAAQSEVQTGSAREPHGVPSMVNLPDLDRLKLIDDASESDEADAAQQEFELANDAVLIGQTFSGHFEADTEGSIALEDKVLINTTSLSHGDCNNNKDAVDFGLEVLYDKGRFEEPTAAADSEPGLNTAQNAQQTHSCSETGELESLDVNDIDVLEYESHDTIRVKSSCGASNNEVLPTLSFLDSSPAKVDEDIESLVKQDSLTNDPSKSHPLPNVLF